MIALRHILCIVLVYLLAKAHLVLPDIEIKFEAAAVERFDQGFSNFLAHVLELKFCVIPEAHHWDTRQLTYLSNVGIDISIINE